MWALIAFIALGIVTATLIEVNERIKAKKQKETGIPSAQEPENCAETACTDCKLMDICDKEEKQTPRKQ